MSSDESAAWLLLLVGAIAVVGIVLSAATFYGHTTFGNMMGGGGSMMGGGGTGTASTGPGGLEWAILVISATLFAGALFLWYRSRSAAGAATPTAISWPPPTPSPAAVSPSPAQPSAPRREPAPTPPRAMDEYAFLKLLGGDERRMYLELRDHGGEMYQRDIVGLGVFSKAKVTRVLDKLESKGLVVREAHGMTNRVRLVKQMAK